jgi:UDP-2,3-diacylglucosamine pyrophosphatase LpxH
MHVVLCLALAACGTTRRASQVRLAQPPEGPRVTVFVSDLHMGPGKMAEGVWTAFEDFRWAEDFAAFLTAIDEAGGGKTDLVFVGDAFELWQSSTVECASRKPDVGCSEAEAVRRMERALRDHADTIAAIGAFARKEDNRVYFVPGNHDVALLFPEVSARLLDALDAPERAEVPTSGYWLSRDGRTYAEHGQQVAGDLNAYDDWPAPFIDGSERHLRRSWGEQFVRSFYDAYERRYPVIDNINSVKAGVSWGLAHEKLQGLGTAVGRFLRFALTRTSRDQGDEFAGRGAGPAWDVAAIRAQKGTFLIESLADDDPLRDEATRAEVGEMDAEAAALTDDEILEICEERAALATEQPPRARQCPSGPAAGDVAARLFSSRRKVLGRRLASALAEVRRSEPEREPFQVFVWGHTHEAEPERRVEAPQGWGASVVNSGAWQRVVSQKWFETAARAKGLRKEDWISGIQLEELPRCYAFVRVAAPGAAPALRYWSAGQDGRLGETESCRAACRKEKDCGGP